MLRGFVCAALMALCLSSIGFAREVRHLDPEDVEIRNLLLEAFQSVSPQHREAKLREVLAKDPENYYALLKMGELELERSEKAHLKAIEYFLLAALAQPQRAEAYLALAQAYFDMGYVPEGTEYMIKALMGPHTRLTYEAVSLEGQNFLDTANFYAAVITYANAALSANSPWKDDPHLLRKLYQAASLSDAPSFWVWKDTGAPAEGVGNVYWIPYVFAKFVAGQSSLDEEATYRAFLKVLREQAEKIREIYPKLSPRAAEKLINVKLYPRVMEMIRARLGESETLETAVQDRFILSKKFYNFGACDKERARMLDPDMDLYEVFLEASIKDPTERRKFMNKLDKIKKQALEEIKGIDDPRERGKALFKWLRENLLVKYDAVDGIPAEGVIDKNKYLCLSGAIVYTLFARDAGLKVNGFLRPNHAFAVMYDKRGDRINVETTGPVKDTAESPSGFDLAEELVRARGTDLRGRAAAEGEISPLDLVAYQYTNVGLSKIDQLMFNKYRDQLNETLKEAGLEPHEIQRLVEIWRHFGDQGSKVTAWLLTSLKYPEFHDEMMVAIDQALDNFGEARSFNPFNIEFLNVIENTADGFTKLATVRPASSMLKRLRRLKEEQRKNVSAEVQQEMRDEAEAQAQSEKEKNKEKDKEKAKAKEKTAEREGKKPEPSTEAKRVPAEEEEQPEVKTYDKEEKTASALKEEEKTPLETSKEWSKEKEFWISSLKRLERVAKRHPCSTKLKRVLLEHSILVTEILGLAKQLNAGLDTNEKMQYEDIIDELNRIRTEFLDVDPDMAAALSTRISQLL